jgi:hypothetical protein
MTVPKPKPFVMSSTDPENAPVEARLIRAQTESQVRKFLEAEAIKAFWKTRKIEPASMEEYGELRAAGVRVEIAEE